MARDFELEFSEDVDEKRDTAEIMLLSCLLQDLSLITETPLEEEDFSTPRNKFYFKLIEELSTRYKEVNEFTVVNFLQVSEGLMDEFDDYGGTKVFNKIKNMANIIDFETYLDEVVKYRLIDDYSNKLAIDINKEVSVGGKKIIPANKFPSMSAEQVLNFYDMQLSSVSVKSVKSDMKAESLYYTDEEIEKMASGEYDETTYFDVTLTWEDENGDERYHRNFPLLNRAIDGICSGNGIYFLGGFSGTGKTTMLVNMVMGLIEQGEKVILVSNEQKSGYFKRILVSYIAQYVFGCWSLDRTKIKHFNFNEEEKQAFFLANEFIKEKYSDCLKFFSVIDFNIDKILREVKKLKLAEGYSTLCIETFKAQSALDNAVQDMVENSRKLDAFEKEMDMKVILPIQLMTSLEGKVSYLNSSMIASSKHIKDVANAIILVRKVLDKELDEDDSKYFLKPYIWKTNEHGKLVKKYFKIIDGQDTPRRTLEGDTPIEKEYTLDKRKKYLLCFIDKSRESDDNSKIILQEMIGRTGRIRDIGYVDNVYGGLFY